MKSVILALVTVLIYAVNTADGIKCESSYVRIIKDTGDLDVGWTRERDCIESDSCAYIVYTYVDGNVNGPDTHFEASCGNESESSISGFDYCEYEEYKTCQQWFCTEELCNAFKRSYPPTTEPSTTEPPTTEPPTTEPSTTELPTTEPLTTEPPTTEPPTTEPPITQSLTTMIETTVETSTYTSSSSNCPLLSEDGKVNFNCSTFYDDLSKCGRRRAWSCDYSSWRLNVLEVFLKEFVDKIPEESEFKLPKCGNDDGISCESSEKCCYTSYSGCQICHCIDHDYKDRKYVQNIWKQDQELWRKLNKLYIELSSGKSEYLDTC